MNFNGFLSVLNIMADLSIFNVSCRRIPQETTAIITSEPAGDGAPISSPTVRKLLQRQKEKLNQCKPETISHNGRGQQSEVTVVRHTWLILLQKHPHDYHYNYLKIYLKLYNSVVLSISKLIWQI